MILKAMVDLHIQPPDVAASSRIPYWAHARNQKTPSTAVYLLHPTYNTHWWFTI